MGVIRMIPKTYRKALILPTVYFAQEIGLAVNSCSGRDVAIERRTTE